MSTEYDTEEKKLHRKKTHNRAKALLIGVAALAGVGGTVHVAKQERKEKSVKEWKAMAADADSVSVDAKAGHFYAVKQLDQDALDAANAKKAALLAKKQEIIAKANEDFNRAFKSMDIDGMEKAIKAGADNVNQKNSKGQTPLMQALEKSESATMYRAARMLVKYSDINEKDNDGATASDYAAVINTVKGEVLKKDLKERADRMQSVGHNTFMSRPRYENTKETEEYLKHYGPIKDVAEINNIKDVDIALGAVELEIKDIKRVAYEIEADKDGYRVSTPVGLVYDCGMEVIKNEIPSKTSQVNKFCGKYLNKGFRR